MKTFAERFNEAIKLRNVKQAWVAKKTGIAPGTISNWSCGKYSPKEENLRTIAEALNVSEAYLRGYTDDPERLDDSKEQTIYDWLAQGVAGLGEKENKSEDPDEFLIIEKYRTADEKTRKAVRVLLGVEE